MYLNDILIRCIMPENYKTILSRQIPARLQTRDYCVLLNLVKKRNLNNYELLASYLKGREAELKKWLETHKQGVVGAARKQKTSELRFISFVKTRFLPYLH